MDSMQRRLLEKWIEGSLLVCKILRVCKNELNHTLFRPGAAYGSSFFVRVIMNESSDDREAKYIPFYTSGTMTNVDFISNIKGESCVWCQLAHI